MSTTARRATATLLCAVLLVALGLMLANMRAETESKPESLNVDLSFDTFAPGVPQTRTSTVDIPVPSEVTDATVAHAGSNARIDVDLTICEGVSGDCRPLTPGLELLPGRHTLSVEATLTNAVQVHGDVDGEADGDGILAGEIRIVESHSPSMVDTGLLMTVAGAGLLAVAVGAVAVRPRHPVVGATP